MAKPGRTRAGAFHPHPRAGYPAATRAEASTMRRTADRVVAVLVAGSAIPRITRKRHVVARERLIAKRD